MIEPGSVIGGRYRLDQLLGEGGMGAVWAATHTLTNKRVAIKLLKADIASPETLRRFVLEARAASAVRHPNVVEVHDILSLDDGSPAMVMDFLEGETLAQFLEHHGPIELGELATIMAPVLSAVGSAHAVGIVHRDLKPYNIFLARLGDGRTEPMVLDFGIAKVLPFSEKMVAGSVLTASGAMLGTPYYMAPEQAFGEKDVDARVDIWSLGVILYECASGRKPIDGETLGHVFKMLTSEKRTSLHDVAPHLPTAFVALVDGMMQRDRDLRPPDLREPFEKLRSWSDAASGPSSGAARSFPPPLVAAQAEGLELAGTRIAAAAHGLGASAVPVTRGVATARSRRLAPVVIAGGVVAAFVLGALVVAALRGSAAPVAANSSLAASALPSARAGSPSAVPTPSASASVAASASASESASAAASSVPGKQRPSGLKPGTKPRKLLPGGVAESVPF